MRPTHHSQIWVVTSNYLYRYTMQQMFEVVSQVDHYQEFLPWCKKSVVTSRGPEFLKADLMVGFPPVSESYTSFVTFKKPYFIKVRYYTIRFDI